MQDDVKDEEEAEEEAASGVDEGKIGCERASTFPCPPYLSDTNCVAASRRRRSVTVRCRAASGIVYDSESRSREEEDERLLEALFVIT